MAATNEPLLTRYIICKTDEQGINLERIGQQDARGREDAIRKFFAEPLADHDGFYVPISENAFKLFHVQAKVKTSVGDVELPPLPVPVQATLPVD